MESPLKWTTIKLFILSIIIRHSLSENTIQGVPTSQNQVVYREVTKESPSTNVQSLTPQLLNSLLTIAAANGVLPEVLTKIQPLGITPEITAPVQDVQKTSVAPMQHPYQHEAVRAAQPMVPTASHTKPIPPLQFTPAHPTTTMPSDVPPLVISPGLNQITQQNNPFIPPTQQYFQPPPLILHPQPKEEVCNCPEPVVMPGQVPVPPAILPMVNAPIEFTRSLINEPMYANSILTTGSGQTIPVNLQISIPPPNVEPPRITFINAALPTQSTEHYPSSQMNPYYYPNWPPYYTQPIPPQQIIVQKKKSSIKEWLPLILLAMFNNDRGSCNGECCRPCKSGRGNVPVPFPIPIPTNSPIINTGSSHHRSSRKRGHCDEDDWLE